MGKPTGFLEYHRETSKETDPLVRIQNFEEFHTYLPLKKQQEQGARCMACGVPFCQSGMMIGGMASGCPLHNLIPEWNDLVYTKDMEKAYERLMRTNCFPEFTSRVCPALCEAACTCGLHTDPVSTKENEHAIIEYAYENGLVTAQPPRIRTGKTVAVIGSGPAGLAAAFYLNRRGHRVTVYEKNDRIGGLLRYGIPNMKLDKKIIDRRLRLMAEEGIQFEVSRNITKQEDAQKLLQSYDRVILACGASLPRDINVPGRDAKGIYFAVDFLTSVTKSLLDSGLEDGTYIPAKGKHVLVIGGGDTGNDCVGTAIRLGAKSVTQLEMMPKQPDERVEENPWPQWPRICKTDYGQEEAIAVFGKDPRMYQMTVTAFEKDKKGAVTEAHVISLEPNRDETGRMQMIPVEGTEKKIKADLVLIAAGFLGARKDVADAFEVELDQRGRVKTVPGAYEVKEKKIFTAGDMHRGQSLVVWAIEEGREAARAVDESLMGYTNL